MLICSPLLFKLLTLGRKGYSAMAVFPFVITKIPRHEVSKTVINHEKIHHRQQVELLILPFAALYIMAFLWGLFKYKNWQQAYKNISFEREAYAHEHDLNYLKNRKMWAQWRTKQQP